MVETWAVVFATLMGPVLAVQAQKWIERRREVANRRSYVFSTLMATRGARMDPEHVRALNMIDLAFYGSRFIGRPVRSQACQSVVDAWREYHHHLNQPQPPAEDEARWEALVEVRDNLFVSLLSAMAVERKFEFDRVQLKTGAYYPKGFFDMEQEAAGLRSLAKEVLSGGNALRIKIEAGPEPGAPEAADAGRISESAATGGAP